MSDYDETLFAAQALTPDERLKLIARLWASLPSEVWSMPADGQLAEAKRRMDQQGLTPGESVPWPVVERMLADCVRSSRPKIYSAPRRFDLATIFVVTSAYGLLFAALSGLDFPPAVRVLTGVFITAVGIGQAILFGGLKPRTASIVVGAVMYGMIMFGVTLWGGRLVSPFFVAISLVYGAVSGAVLGYVAGALVGGVFLVADKLRIRLARRASVAEAEEESPFTAAS